MKTLVELTEDVPRDAEGIKCPSCNAGYAERTDCSPDECREYGCGRDQPGDECCARAFICCACGARIVGKAVTPEME